ncbi:MAG: ferredoxin [Patescibacteria group bacterium]|jgi:ferredoxin
MVKVDKNMCIGCGMCVGLCPDIFALDADGKSEVIKDEVTPCAKEAAKNCPVGAINVK